MLAQHSLFSISIYSQDSLLKKHRPKLYKESRKSKKELPLLIDWFKVFMNTYKH